MSDPKSKKDLETSEGLETDADALGAKSDDDISPEDTSAETPATSDMVDDSEEVSGDDAIEDAELVDETADSSEDDGADITDPDGTDGDPAPSDDVATDETHSTDDMPADAAAQEAPEHADSAPDTTPAPAVAEKRGGFFGPFLGGVVAAGLGFGLCYYLVGQGILGAGTEDAFAEDRAKIGALSDQITALQAEMAGVGEDPRVAPLADGLTAVQGVVGGLQGEVGALQSEIETQSGLLSGVESEVQSLSSQLETIAQMTADSAGSPADTAAIAALQAQLQSQQAENAEMQSQLQEMAEAARAEMDEVRARAGELQAETQAAVDEATNRAAVANLTSALESGTPLAPALANLAGDIPDSLSAVADTGVVTVLELQQGFPAAARAGLSESLKVTVGEDPTDRVLAFLQAQVGARSLEGREGDDPNAILGRAQEAVTRADFAQALAEIGTLPSEGQAAMAGWTADAQARVDAIAARDALTAELISN